MTASMLSFCMSTHCVPEAMQSSTKTAPTSWAASPTRRM
jgi:hypothetical protein